jgi:outer membrane lipoprotein-sorting protein
MRRTSTLLAGLIGLMLVTGPFFADSSPSRDPLVARAVAYLDTLNDVKGPFRQTGAHGDVATGTLWLARPGRARFQYDPPSDMLITSDGRSVAISDPQLRTFQRTPLGATPLAVFLADHIRLDRGARIVRVDRSDGGFSITANDARGLSQGDLTLYFGDDPMRLEGWAIRDGAGRVTRVSLGPLTTVAPPPASLFTQSRPG